MRTTQQRSTQLTQLTLLLLALNGCGRALPPDLVADSKQAELIRSAMSGGQTSIAANSDTAVGDPNGWGTLRGAFRFGGTAPDRVFLNVDKDQAVCAPQGKKVTSEELVVDSQGGIRDVVVILTQTIPDSEPWTHPTMRPGKTEAAIFDQKECVFLTHVLVSQVSQPVTIKNSDSVGHNTNIKPRKNASYDQTIAAAGLGEYKPTKEEEQPIPVSCAIHPWMKAWMLFRNNSYFAVSRSDGSFEIPNLPSGVDLEFRVWQEKAGFLSDVTVNDEDPKPKWSKGKFRLSKLQPNEVREFNVIVKASSFK